MTMSKLIAILIGAYLFLGLLAFFVISALIKPTNLQEWGEFAKILGIVLTLLASVMTTVVSLITAQAARSLQLEVTRQQRLTEAMKIALPAERQAYFELYRAAENVFRALRPLDNGQWNEEDIQRAREELKKVSPSVLLLRLRQHRVLWKRIIQRIEYITGEVKKRQGDITSQTDFWLNAAGDFAQMITDFEEAAEERLQFIDESPEVIQTA